MPSKNGKDKPLYRKQRSDTFLLCVYSCLAMETIVELSVCSGALPDLNMTNYLPFTCFKVINVFFLFIFVLPVHVVVSLCSARHSKMLKSELSRCVCSFCSDVVCQDSFWRKYLRVLIRVKRQLMSEGGRGYRYDG